MESDHLEDLGIDGRIILIRIFKKLDRGTDLSQGKDRCQTLVIAVMNLINFVFICF